MAREAREALALDPARVVAKLPATLEAISSGRALHDEGYRCALTAVYSPAQALLAHEAGCAWVIPYVDRAARHSAGHVVEELAAVLERLGSETRILAASLKTAAAGDGCGRGRRPTTSRRRWTSSARCRRTP